MKPNQMSVDSENMIYSPLSIKYALYMLNDGANGSYIRDTYSKYAKEKYKNILMDKYNAEIKYDAFKNASNINSWIENKTLGKIKNMLSDEIVTNPDHEMFLINALAISMELKQYDDEQMEFVAIMPNDNLSDYVEEFSINNMEDEMLLDNQEPKIDKPFMYLIRDKKTDEIWFVGTVYEPNS